MPNTPSVVTNICFHPEQIKTWDEWGYTHIYIYLFNEHITTNENMLSTLRILEGPKGEGKSEPWGGFTESEISHVAADSQ